jgi:aspartyl protease family protein
MYDDGPSRSLTAAFGAWLAVGAAALIAVAHADTVGSTVSRLVTGAFDDGARRDRPDAADADDPDADVEAADAGDTDTGDDGRGLIDLRADARGHFTAPVEIDGRRVTALVDTGATIVLLTYEDARRIGLTPAPADFTMTAQTANGRARIAPVTLDRVVLQGVQVRGVRAAIAERGRLTTSLLGMSFLTRVGGIEIRDGRLRLGGR